MHSPPGKSEHFLFNSFLQHCAGLPVLKNIQPKGDPGTISLGSQALEHIPPALVHAGDDDTAGGPEIGAGVPKTGKPKVAILNIKVVIKLIKMEVRITILRFLFFIMFFIIFFKNLYKPVIHQKIFLVNVSCG